MSTLSTAAPAAVAKPADARRGTPVLRWLLWSPAIALILGAATVAGGLLFFLLPLLGLGYGVFALIASLGPDDPKETP